MPDRTGLGHHGSDPAGQADDAKVPGGALASGPADRQPAVDGKDAGAFRTIGEVTRALDIAPHVLRYWEEQFPMLRPVKRSGGRRYYRPSDIALLETIHRLVHSQGYTLRGARQFLESKNAGRGQDLAQQDLQAPKQDTLLDGLIALRADLARLLG